MRIMTRNVIAALACLWGSLAFGQANNSSNWQTPGNQVVGGVVHMLPNAANLAAPVGPNVPPGTPITASATGTTAATTATLAAVAGKTTYICGFSINSTATAAAAGNATVTGTVTGTLNFEMGTGATPAVVITQQSFTPCVPASAVNTSIAVVSAAPGTGGVISVSAWGFQF